MKKDTLTPRLRALGSPAMRRTFLSGMQAAAIREAKHLVPRKTGNLDRSIRAGAINDERALILAGGVRDIGYAAAVEFGTKAHVIVPKRARVLAWGGDRRLSGTLRKGAHATSFAMRVQHPGTRAKPYLVPGARAAMKKVGVEGIVKAWNDAA